MEKEHRKDQLRHRWVRRLMQQDLALAFTSWQDYWEAHAFAMNLLRNAANHLATPGLVRGFHGWLGYIELKRGYMEERKKRGLEEQNESLGDKMKRMQASHEEKLVSLAAERAKLLEKIAQLSGSAERMEMEAEAQRAADRQSRVELLQRQVTRRIMNRGLSRGWTGWFDYWEGRVYAKKQLKEAAGRMRMPELARGISAWLFFCQMSKRAASVERLKEKLSNKSKQLESDLRQAQFDKGQVEMVRVAQEDELRALRSKVTALLGEADKAQSAQLASEALRREFDELKEFSRISQAALSETRGSLKSAEHEIARQRDASQNLLEQLLDEQRKRFQVELETYQQNAELHIVNLGAVEREAATYKAELEDLRLQLERAEAYERTLNEQRQHMQAEVEALEARLKAKTEELEAQLKLQIDARIEAELALRNMRIEYDEVKKKLHDEALIMKERILRLESFPVEVPKQPSPKRDKRERRQGAGPLGHIDLDEGPNAPPISEQIKRALKANAGKVLDLFRSWDADGDGQVTRAEFHRAMSILGLEVPKASIDDLFNQWDRDGGGELGLQELTKILRAPGKSSPVQQVQTAGKAAMVMNAFKSPNRKT